MKEVKRYHKRIKRIGDLRSLESVQLGILHIREDEGPSKHSLRILEEDEGSSKHSLKIL